MSKPLQSNPMHSALLKTAVLALGVVTCSLAAVGPAAADPLVMGPLYEEPARAADAPAPPSAAGCRVHIVQLTDRARAPEVFGAIVTFRTIAAPADREAWLRSVFQVGLSARGFKPSFATAGDETPVDPSVVQTRIRVQGLWISTLGTNKNGTIVLRAASARGATPTDERVYRSDKTSVNMWGSRSEFNGLLNQVLAETLDDFAADLRTQCTAPIPAPAPVATPAAETPAPAATPAPAPTPAPAAPGTP